jgi:hypothetical protein
MEEFFAVVFIECMVENNRCFSEKDFYKLLATQRLDKSKVNFNALMEAFLLDFEFDSYEKIDNIWQPKGSFVSHKAIWNIIDELDLHLEVENSLGGFYETSCDVVQKINNYLWLCEKEALQ